MPIAAALEKSLLDAFKGNFKLPDVIFSYSKDLNISRLKVKIQMLPDLLKTFNLENPTQVIKSVTKIANEFIAVNDRRKKFFGVE